MPMSDGRGRLKKIAFQIGDKFFRFAINPENYSHANPHRTTAIKTKSRIVIEDFQSDIPYITLSGTTGFNPTGRAEDRGIAKIKEMKKFLEEYAQMGGNGRTAAQDFFFHNFTNDESYVVHLSPEGVTYSQDVNSPLTYRYEIKFAVLRKASEPAEEDIVDPEIGNKLPSFPVNPVPAPDRPNSGNNGGSFSPDGGAGGGIYNEGTEGTYQNPINNEPVNPQAPSPVAYTVGMTGLQYALGYYARRNLG